MPGFLQRFLPRDGDFSALFRKQAENVVSGANTFTAMLEHYTGVPEQVQRWAWVLTIPGAALLGAALFRFLVPLLS